MQILSQKINVLIPEMVSAHGAEISAWRSNQPINIAASNPEEVRRIWVHWQSNYFNNTDHFGHYSLMKSKPYIEAPNPAFTLLDRILTYNRRRLSQEREPLIDLLISDFTFYYLTHRG